ncbi:DUF4256 domain-containing protein [Candidatus Peregrinibacteria bacterium]|nr:MAG: DUF4256 domain-containing protein [Candidatus Peregrinibacteria bacterium]
MDTPKPLESGPDGRLVMRITERTGFEAMLERVQDDAWARMSSTIPKAEEPAAKAGESENSTKERVIFMGKLKERYETNKHGIACHSDVTWGKIEAKLSANPAKLDALKKMDDSGGEPDVTEVQGENFLFDELAEKLPASRKQATYGDAFLAAEKMRGDAKLMHPDRYKKLGNEMKIVMDNTEGDWVWLDTSDREGLLSQNQAICGCQRKGTVLMGLCKDNDQFRTLDDYQAFRCSITI